MAKIEPKIFDELKRALSSFDGKYLVGEELNRSKLTDDLRNYDEALLSKLFEVEFIKQHFIKEVAGQKLFQIEQLEEAIFYNDYWDTSYTKYENCVGLASKGKFLQDSQDVVLDFPFKDGVLTASMTKEDSEDGYDDAFLNEVIEKDEIDRLFDKKILINAVKFDENGENSVVKFDKDTDNLIIKGNNLLALHALADKYAGSVKLIYIDPPYNTGSDSFAYNDKFNHSAWLTFMKNRLEIAYELLAEDGILWVQTDDVEVNYLGVLLDEIMGRNNFINLVTVKTKIGGVSGSAEGKSLKDATEFIQVYAKNKEQINLEPVYAMTPVWDYINEEYIEAGKSWKYTSVLTELGERQLIKFDEEKNRKYYHYPNAKQMSVKQYATEHNLTEEEVYNSVPDKIFQTTNAQTSIRTTVMEETAGIDTGFVSIEYVPTKGKNKDKVTEILYTSTKRMFMFLSDMLTEDKDGNLLYKEKLTTLWDDIQYNNLSKEGKVEFPNGKKPEKLLQNIIEMSSYEGDIVLDFFGGSGSTAAVAHKLGRKWITCEQIDSQIEIMKERLQNVVSGKDDKGISGDVNWQGGGSFVYAELFPKNMGYLQDIIHSNTTEELKSVYDRMLQGTDTDEPADISFRADLSKIDWAEGFDENKRLLVKLLDKNGLYYNYSEIDDTNVRDLVSDEDYAFNKAFYKGGE
ncbi:site-specific DNA-methyltransferase [Priestia megaterium]|nr:site-specific DNA-methyltransferase [Priestia megaterium]